MLFHKIFKLPLSDKIMFNKKCQKCGEKLSKKANFCSNCGFNFAEKKEKDYGMLGTSDFDVFREMESEMPFFMKFPLKKIMNSLMKDLEKNMKQLEQFDERKAKVEQTPNSLNIEIKMVPTGEETQVVKQKRTLPKPTEEKIKKYSSLPKKEAKTSVKRFANSMIYEISLPEVKSEENLIIRQFPESIEVKAFSDKNSYYVIIPSKKPVKAYELKKDLLSLEVPL